MATKSERQSIQMTPETKAALERAAADEGRSLASYIERALIEKLRAKGYLPEDAR